MMNPFSADNGAMRRAHIEAVLADYPHVESEETETLLRWFRNEATALDVGLIASDPQLAKPYRQLKADHLDRLSGGEIVRAFIFVSVAAVGVIGVVWSAM